MSWGCVGWWLLHPDGGFGFKRLPFLPNLTRAKRGPKALRGDGRGGLRLGVHFFDLEAYVWEQLLSRDTDLGGGRRLADGVPASEV